MLVRFIVNRIQLNVSPHLRSPPNASLTYFHKILLPAIAIAHCVAVANVRWHVDYIRDPENFDEFLFLCLPSLPWPACSDDGARTEQ